MRVTPRAARRARVPSFRSPAGGAGGRRGFPGRGHRGGTEKPGESDVPEMARPPPGGRGPRTTRPGAPPGPRVSRCGTASGRGYLPPWPPSGTCPGTPPVARRRTARGRSRGALVDVAGVMGSTPNRSGVGASSSVGQVDDCARRANRCGSRRRRPPSTTLVPPQPVGVIGLGHLVLWRLQFA